MDILELHSLAPQHFQVTHGIEIACGAVHGGMAMRQPALGGAAVQALHHEIRSRGGAAVGRAAGAGEVQQVDLAPGARNVYIYIYMYIYILSFIDIIGI